MYDGLVCVGDGGRIDGRDVGEGVIEGLTGGR